jgi:uncharacterized protein (TIGR00251 family)
VTWFRWDGTSLRLEVTVRPGSRREGADALHGDRLRIAVNAPAQEGRANQRLVEWVAEEFGVPKRAVQLLRGAGSRNKSLLVESPATLPGWFLALGGGKTAAGGER